MSASIATSRKSVCRTCARTVAIERGADGSVVVLDTEVITAVVYGEGSGPIKVRRVHGELCLRYKAERERAEARRKLSK